MSDGNETPTTADGVKGERKAAIQVICLGSGGGPSEDNVTGLLVRSTTSGWVKGSLLAVDAGSHMAAITRILEKDLPVSVDSDERADADITGSNDLIFTKQTSALDSSPPASPGASPRAAQQAMQAKPIILESGPFAGLPLPHASARANAAYIVRSHVSTYLITHPHLDHISGFAINTASFHATSRPKRLAALPFTVDAIKQHIFNDVIWPNMSDEDGGIGFVTFQRLKEGGDVMVGEGDGRGYIEVCDGLVAKGFKISHGKCMRPGHSVSNAHRGSVGNLSDVGGGNYTPRHSDSRHMSISHLQPPETPNQNHHNGQPSFSQQSSMMGEGLAADAVDSTAYFIRDSITCKEVLIFGDVEPDSVSLAPRLSRVWSEAASKIASGVLTGIFIECSYDDSQGDAVLFGHFAPRHMIAELRTLADMVKEERSIRASEKAMRKRKRGPNGSTSSAVIDDNAADKKRSRSLASRTTISNSRRSSVPDYTFPGDETPSHTPQRQVSSSDQQSLPKLDTRVTHQRGPSVTFGSSEDQSTTSTPNKGAMGIPTSPPLTGLKIIVIHVKDTLKDGPHVSQRILAQLNDHAAALEEQGEELGCEFIISKSGEDYWF